MQPNAALRGYVWGCPGATAIVDVPKMDVYKIIFT